MLIIFVKLPKTADTLPQKQHHHVAKTATPCRKNNITMSQKQQPSVTKVTIHVEKTTPTCRKTSKYLLKMQHHSVLHGVP